MKNLIHISGAFVIVLVIWQLTALIGGWNEALFPTPLHTMSGFGELLRDGVLAADITASLGRFLIGYLASVLLAMVLGLILGWYKGIWAFLNPIAQVLRPISPMAWLPFIVLFFGIGEMPALVIIFIAAFFPVLLVFVFPALFCNPEFLEVVLNG